MQETIRKESFGLTFLDIGPEKQMSVTNAEEINKENISSFLSLSLNLCILGLVS